MFFLVSKLLAFFIKPMSWIFFLLLIKVFFNSKNKWTRNSLKIALALLLIFGNTYIFNVFADKLEKNINTDLNSLKFYKNLIVLGGYNTFSEKSKFQNLNDAVDRLTTVLPLIQDSNKQIIFSGGSGILGYKGITESEMTKQFVDQFQNRNAKIFYECHSKNTIENIVNSKKILDSLQNKDDVLVISSTYHIRRVNKILKAQNLKWKTLGVESIIDENYPFENNFLPQARILFKWDLLIHEWIGYYFSK